MAPPADELELPAVCEAASGRSSRQASGGKGDKPRRHRRDKSSHRQRLRGLALEMGEIADVPSSSASSDEVLRKLHKWRKMLSSTQEMPDGGLKMQRQVYAELTDFVRPPQRASLQKEQPQNRAPMLPQLVPAAEAVAGASPEESAVLAERLRLREWGIDKAYARRFRLQIPDDPPETASSRRKRLIGGCVRMMRPGAVSPKHCQDHKGNLVYANGVQGASAWKW